MKTTATDFERFCCNVCDWVRTVCLDHGSIEKSPDSGLMSCFCLDQCRHMSLVKVELIDLNFAASVFMRMCNIEIDTCCTLSAMTTINNKVIIVKVIIWLPKLIYTNSLGAYYNIIPWRKNHMKRVYQLYWMWFVSCALLTPRHESDAGIFIWSKFSGSRNLSVRMLGCITLIVLTKLCDFIW